MRYRFDFSVKIASKCGQKSGPEEASWWGTNRLLQVVKRGGSSKIVHAPGVGG
jgi:hypothetical protein